MDRAPRWRWIVESFFKRQQRFKGCQLTIQPAFEGATCAFLFIQHCCMFVFLQFGQMPLSFFGEICGRIGNEMPRKDKFWSRRGGFNWTKKRWGRTSVSKEVPTDLHLLVFRAARRKGTSGDRGFFKERTHGGLAPSMVNDSSWTCRSRNWGPCPL